MSNLSEVSKPEKFRSRLDEWRTVRMQSHNYQVDTFKHWFEYNAMEMNPDYQRDYVWTEKEQVEFLSTLMQGYPVGSIALSEDRGSLSQDQKWIEVVDGKQRLTTLKKVFDNEIPLPLPDGSSVYWNDLHIVEQRRFRAIPLSVIGLDGTTKAERLEFFYRVNFTGVPQSELHMYKVKNLIKLESEK